MIIIEFKVDRYSLLTYFILWREKNIVDTFIVVLPKKRNKFSNEKPFFFLFGDLISVIYFTMKTTN